MKKHLSKSPRSLNPHVSVDCVIFGFDVFELKVLLIQRKNSKSGSHSPWALPGDLILDTESLDEAAQRVLQELTGLQDLYLEQLYAFGDPNRVRSKPNDADWIDAIRENPLARVITVAYYSLINLKKFCPNPDSFADRVEWFALSGIPNLAFDHNAITEAALRQLREKLRRQPVGFELLPPKFTMGQLQKVYEEILGAKLDKRNFRKKMMRNKLLIQLDEKQLGVSHKPASYFRFDKRKYKELRSLGFDFSLTE